MDCNVFVREEVCIQVYDVTNDDMDCVFFVDRKDEDRALRVLEKAYEDFWNQQWETYGDFLTSEMQKAGISYEVYFKGSAADRYVHQTKEKSEEDVLSATVGVDMSDKEKVTSRQEESAQKPQTMRMKR